MHGSEARAKMAENKLAAIKNLIVDADSGRAITDEIIHIIDSEVWDGYQTIPAAPKDDRPHCRACGITLHEHGRACHQNCPTCGGRDE